mmetsp:Transcript_36161/g.76189  ORF Transcript_36161/g.76189 Transcript_36161/m.76189 type:complete len:267 (+) Transcript_36161:235-1035(+)
MTFIGTSSDLQQLGISPQSFHGVFSYIPIPSHHLNRAISYIFCHLSTVQLDSIGIQSIPVGIEIEPIGKSVEVRLSRHVFRVTFGDVLLNLAETIQIRLAKRRSIRGVHDHFIQGPACNAHRHGRKGHSFNLQISHHAQRGTIHLPHDVRLGYQHVFKDQFRGGRGTHAELILNLLTYRKPFRATLHQELCDVRPPLSSTSVDKEEITRLFSSECAIGDPHFGSIQYVPIAFGVVFGIRSHSQDVRSSIRFGHAHSSDFGTVTYAG